MASYKKLAELVYRLHQKTTMGEINWEGTVTPGVYQASFSDYSIQISLRPSEESRGAKDVVISVFGDDGNEIESFTDPDIQSEWLEEFSHTAMPYPIMHETYEIARRLALGTEQAINQILSELEGDGSLS